MSEFLQHRLPTHLAARQSAMRREWGVQVAALLLAVICFVGAGLLVGPINQIRKDRQLVVDPETIRGLPPDIQLLSKMGTFRALAIDWASIRADRLKEEGKTYEAYELHKIVCSLAPRFPKVWANAAWNMAYNISVMQYTPEARWQWVSNGIKLLRDDGIRYNPKAATLYRELAWIFWHKVCDYLDDEHLNYKKALGVEMERVLGAPPVTVTDEEYFDWFKRIVDAPRELSSWIDGDSAVEILADKLAEVGLDPRSDDYALLGFVARHVRPDLRLEQLQKRRANQDELLARRLAIVEHPANQHSMARLLAGVRSKAIREVYHMDLDWMYDLMVNQYGPLDWRNGYAHTLYWASWGDKVSRDHAASDLSDAMNTARFVFFSLQSMITRGKVVLWPDFDDPFNSYIALTPDTRFIPYLFATYMRLGKHHFGDHPKFREGTPGPNYMTGFVTNMHVWIELLYLEGGKRNIDQAENFLAWLRENNPHPDGSTQDRYLVTVEEFVMEGILEHLHTYTAVNGIIRNFLARGLKQYSIGEDRAAGNSIARAKLCYDYWMEDTKIDINDRRMMQKFAILVADEIISYSKSSAVAPFFKATLWHALPLAQRQMTYDDLRPYFERLCDAQDPPWEVVRAFSEPVGMQAFRGRDIEYRGERDRKKEQGTGHKR